MAAPSGITWGSIYGSGTHRGRLGIYVKLTHTNTETTREVEIWFKTEYTCSDSSNKFYYDCGTDVTSASTYKKSVSISCTSSTQWSTSNEKKLAEYTYTYARGTSAKTYKIYTKLSGIEYIGKTVYANTSFTVPALPSYTVTFNANGGSGAPDNQTKYYGKTLTLSSTKPTRSGYTFVGWGTSSTSTSAAYAAGGSYTANAGDTLYAIWKKTLTLSYNANNGSGGPGQQSATVYNATTSYKFTVSSTKPTRTGYNFLGWATSASATSASYAGGGSITISSNTTLYAVWSKIKYTISYDANGGSGAPGNQTKEYGTALTLSSTKPTRTNYNFLGWATSESATTATYKSGGSYTSNAAVKLYAVWELAYIVPTVTGLKVNRYSKNADGTYKVDDFGTYAGVSFSWECCQLTGDNPVASIKVEWKTSTATSYSSATISASGYSGTVTNHIFTTSTFDVDTTYNIRITVTDKLGGSDPQTKNLTSAKFPIDFKAGGTGVAIGRAAETDNLFDVNPVTRFRQDVMVGEKTGYQDGKTGVYMDAEGYMHIQRSSADCYHPYLGFYVGDATSPAGQIRVNSGDGNMEFINANSYSFGNNIIIPNENALQGRFTSGVPGNLIGMSTNNNTVVGYGPYVANVGNTHLYGKDIVIYSKTAGTNYRPYYRAGDSLGLTIHTSGYVTSSGTNVVFIVPLAKPILGSPTVTITSGSGMVLRQGAKYTHGSAASTNVKPTSYSWIGDTDWNAVIVSAIMSNTENVTNNDAIGVAWNGTITFS